MREPLTIRDVPVDDAEAVAFAASFDHAVFADHPPVYLLCRGERPVAYWQELRLIIARPNWHDDPRICSRRDVLEGSQLVTEHLRQKYGNAIIATPDVAKNFGEGILRHLGYESMNMKLYLATGRVH